MPREGSFRLAAFGNLRIVCEPIVVSLAWNLIFGIGLSRVEILLVSDGGSPRSHHGTADLFSTPSRIIHGQLFGFARFWPTESLACFLLNYLKAELLKDRYAETRLSTRPRRRARSCRASPLWQPRHAWSLSIEEQSYFLWPLASGLWPLIVFPPLRDRCGTTRPIVQTVRPVGAEDVRHAHPGCHAA